MSKAKPAFRTDEGDHALMDTYYLVDYENVSGKAISDCSHLSKTDHLYIYFTDNNRGLPIGIVSNHGSAEFKPIKVSKGNQNVDKRIISQAEQIVRKKSAKRVFIISNDKGYDEKIEEWNEINTVKCERLSSIQKEKCNTVSSVDVNKQYKKESNKLSSEEKNRINKNLQSVLSRAGYGAYANDIVKIVWGCYGKPSFKKMLESELKKSYAVTYEDILSHIDTAMKIKV